MPGSKNLFFFVSLLFFVQAQAAVTAVVAAPLTGKTVAAGILFWQVPELRYIYLALVSGQFLKSHIVPFSFIY